MDYLRRLIVWFITGFGLVSGGFLAFWLWTYIDSPKSESLPKVDNPKEMEFSNVAVVPFTKHLTVTGVLTNRGSRKFESAWLEMSVAQDGKVMYRCSNWYDAEILPNAFVEFQTRCEEVESTNLPSSARVTVAALGVNFSTAGQP